jgi:hypothetical protein
MFIVPGFHVSLFYAFMSPQLYVKEFYGVCNRPSHLCAHKHEGDFTG